MTAWLVLGGVVWCLAAVVVAVVLGRMVRQRDRQRPGQRTVDVPAQQRRELPSLASRLLRRR
ncbi:hypothetical protein ACQEVB_05100 [Pseudonocardia sp. CA-107938]|uniref:hypothetical protein n=1 Tax=Pseudonocardia sp. CA-107938 TaxID=3240021 RepID=UPI003D8FD44C